MYIHFLEVKYMQTQVKAWGNSQGIRLSKDILQAANVEINDILEVKVSDGINVTDAIQSIFDYI